MQAPNIEFKKIYEHDMDLLILEEFIADKRFAKLFLDKVGLGDNYTIEQALHSLSDADGESDLTLILQYPDQKVALLIEDKIDAPTMEHQSQRYHIRASAAEKRGLYTSHYVILAAPLDYHTEHQNDANANYEYRITYEELRDYFKKQTDPRSAFKCAIIDFALREKKAGYQVQEVKSVTEFWVKLRQFCKENYPHLVMVGKDAPKGSGASWPEFRTSLGTIKVVYKSQKGYVDLEFPGYGDRIGYLHSLISSKMTDVMQIWKTGKSASVRISNDKWKLDFSKDFEGAEPMLREILEAVSALCAFASQFNYSDLY